MNGHLFRQNQHYADADLSFLVHTFHDAPALTLMLEAFRTHYPAARMIVCSDGDNNEELPQIAAAMNAEFHLGKNLYARGNRGLVCQRMLTLFLSHPTRYFFKVDPDTGFHRRFNYLPDADGMFGTLQCNPTLCSIQGGFLGITLNAATRLVESRIFLDDSLSEPHRTWASHPPLWKYMKSVNRVSSDWIFGYAATVLGIPQFGFPEVMCKWKERFPNPDLRYAVTHPVTYEMMPRSYR